MIAAVRMMMSSMTGNQHNFAYGELIAYNPVNHTGQFSLPGEPTSNPDPAQPNTVTGFIPVGTMYIGGNGGGAQFPPTIGAQAIIFFLDQGQLYPMCGVLYFTDIEQPPFPDGKTQGWLNDTGAYVKTTLDGASNGDNGGGSYLGGGKFTTVSTTGGHKVVLDDTAKTITITSAGGLKIVLDDNSGKIELAGSTGATADELVRRSDLVTLLSNIQTQLGVWASAHLSNGSGAAGPTTISTISPTGSSKSFSG